MLISEGRNNMRYGRRFLLIQEVLMPKHYEFRFVEGVYSHFLPTYAGTYFLFLKYRTWKTKQDHGEQGLD